MDLNRIEKTRQLLQKNGQKITSLSAGILQDDTAYPPKEILQKSFLRYLKSPVYKPQSNGSIAARKAISAYYQKRNFRVDPENILLTSGTSESYFEIFKMLARPGDEILFPSPSYPLFNEIAQLAEIKIQFYGLDKKAGWEIDLKDLEEKITARTRGIVLVSPHNPTGAVLSEKTLKKISELAERFHLPIISDEVFCEQIFDHKIFPRIGAIAKNVMVFTLNGVSKTWGLPGLKLSWIAVSGSNAHQIVQKLERLTDIFLACSQLSQIFLPDIIKKGAKTIRKIREQLEANRNLTIQMISRLKNISFHHPEAGPYLFLSLHGLSMSDEDLVIQLMKKTGIFVHPGYFYDYEEEAALVISFAGNRQKLKKNLQKLLNFLGRVMEQQ